MGKRELARDCPTPSVIQPCWAQYSRYCCTYGPILILTDTKPWPEATSGMQERALARATGS